MNFRSGAAARPFFQPLLCYIQARDRPGGLFLSLDSFRGFHFKVRILGQANKADK
jgi:hypothetical protein